MLLPALLLFATPTITLDFNAPGKTVSPMLYGLMTEEINYSYDGGLYAELIRNRSFKNDGRNPVYWTPTPGSTATLDRNAPLNAAQNVSLKLQGTVANAGYWGIPVRPNTKYRLSLWARSNDASTLTARLVKDSGEAACETKFPALGPSWKKLEVQWQTPANISPTKDARFELATEDGKTVNVTLVSLFPPTFNDRPNGNRIDLMQMLCDMRPAFLRFPGGNYLEGDTFRDRFPWKTSLGPLEDRPGHMGPWSYRSTDGMGLLEFLNWSEDMGAKPVLGVFAGYVLRRDVIKPGTELQGFVQDALDEIEYVIGDAKRTTWGARRAKDGHPQPFDLQHVEIGNEDWFDDTGSYPGRYRQFAQAIRKKYPRLKIISTIDLETLRRGGVSEKDMPDYIDDHYYNTSWEMMKLATRYDNAPRKGPKVFVGEWASQDVPAPWADVEKKGPTPAMSAAIGDAAFLTGLERNSDIVHLSCYAPLLVNVNPGGRQWGVNLIGYDAMTCFASPSYYVQQMFRTNLGDHTVPLVLANAPLQTRNGESIPAVYCSATWNSASGECFIKVVNALGSAQEIDIAAKGAKFASSGVALELKGDPSWMNSLSESRKVFPKRRNIQVSAEELHWTLPPNSVTVFQFRRSS